MHQHRSTWPSVWVVVVLCLTVQSCGGNLPDILRWGWIDRFEDEQAVVVMTAADQGYRETIVQRERLPRDAREGDLVVGGICLAGSRRWLEGRVSRLMARAGFR